MCSKLIIDFGIKSLKEKDVHDKRVIEVGSQDVNGSLRDYVVSLNPREYIGIDFGSGKGVDIICNAEDSVDMFGKESFDIVICTELLEHVFNWKKVISNIKNLCVPNGILVITTRSKGFHYHPYPYDFWRYEIDDMRKIFSDFTIEYLENDPEGGGVFIKAVKPINFIENNLTEHELYRMPESIL